MQFVHFLRTAMAATALCMASTARADLVSSWSADGNPMDSTGNNPGTLVNGVTYGPGVSGQAFVFDGSDYVQAGTTGMPTGDQDRTIFLWFNISSTVSSETFLAGYGGFGNFFQAYEIFAQGNTLTFSQWGQAFSGGTFTLNQWHSAAITNIGNSETLYLDGVQVASGNLTLDTSSGSSFYLGRIPGSLGDSRQMDGSVDDVQVYNTALTASQIGALSTLSTVPEPSSFLLALVGFGAIGCGFFGRKRK